MNKISAALTQENRDAIAQAIRTIEEHLPLLVDLVVEERSALAKMGNKIRSPSKAKPAEEKDSNPVAS